MKHLINVVDENLVISTANNEVTITDIKFGDGHELMIDYTSIHPMSKEDETELGKVVVNLLEDNIKEKE